MALPAACLISAVLAVFCQYALFRPLQTQILNCFIVGIGASLAIRSASWAISVRSRSPFLMFPGVLKIGGVFIARQRLFAAALCIVLAVALYLFLHYTKPGKRCARWNRTARRHC